MVRLGILLVLLSLTVFEWWRGAKKPVYLLAVLGLTVFFSLRYGQGTDYLTYLSIYANVEPLHTLPNYFAFNYNKIEIGFFYLISFFRMLGAHFGVFIAFVTISSFVLLTRFIRRFCPSCPMFALTFFFAVYSITYMESGIRQLLAISIILGVVLVAWSQRKYVISFCGIAAASLLHTSALLMLLLPLLFCRGYDKLYLIEWKKKTSLILVFLMLAASAVINFVDLSGLIALMPPQLEYTLWYYYQQNHTFSLLALANRSLFAAIAFILAWRAKDRLSQTEKLLFNLYMVGFAIYVTFMSFDLIASRCNVYFRVVEIALLPALMMRNRDLVRRTVVALPVMLMLMSFLYVKDITAVMDFAQYYDSNPLHYPYITIFNPDSLLDAKFVNVKNANAMNAYQTSGFSWNEYYAQLLRKPVNRSTIVPY